MKTAFTGKVSNMIGEILPDHVKTVTIEKNLEKGFDYRKITVEEK